jgi:drug/metabolite transporter (DMT)-like permease
MSINNFTKEKIKVTIAFLNVYILWGATYFAIVYALKGFPPFVLSSIRFLIAGLVLLSWRLMKGEKIPSLKNIGINGFSGILILVAGTGMVSWAQQYISSSEAAILGATQPFFFILFDKKQWKIYFSNKLILAGLIIGFFGLFLFVHQSQNGSEKGEQLQQIIAYVVLIFSAACWVAGALLSKRNGEKSTSSVFMNTVWQLLAASIITAIISTFQGDWNRVNFTTVPLEAWLGLLFLIVGGSLISYISFVWLISKRPAAIVSTFTYVNPVVAVILGVVFLGEFMTRIQLLSLFIILIGVLLTNVSSYKLTRTKRVKLARIKFIIWNLFFIPRYKINYAIEKIKTN